MTMTEPKQTDACQVPLEELLKTVPLNACLDFDTPDKVSHHIPVGRYCHEAANIISAERLKARGLVRALTRIAKGDYGNGVDLSFDEAAKYCTAIAKDALTPYASAADDNNRGNGG